MDTIINGLYVIALITLVAVGTVTVRHYTHRRIRSGSGTEGPSRCSDDLYVVIAFIINIAVGMAMTYTLGVTLYVVGLDSGF